MSLELARRATRERQVISPGDETLVAVAPNGSYIALSTADGMLRIREIGTFKELSSLVNGSRVTSAMFTADRLSPARRMELRACGISHPGAS